MVHITNMSHGRKLIGFANAYTEGMGGGYVRFIEIFKHINNFEISIVTSLLGKKMCKRKGLMANYLITTKEKKFKNVILTYIKRIIKALFLNVNITEGDIIYSISDFLPDVFPAFIWKLKNRKVMWTQLIHHLIPHPSKRKGNLLSNVISYLAQRISFLFIKHYCDLIIVVNPLTKKMLAGMGFNISKIRVNPNGIDIDYFRNVKPDKNVRYDGIFLARLHPSKGIFDLIEIWKFFCKKIPNAKLAVIGCGNKKIIEELERRIINAGLADNIDVLGYLENDRVFGIIKSSKIFISPSHEEGFGIAILEAMACGLPVVAWDLPVYREVFPKGIIGVPENDISRFGGVIIELLEDENKRKLLAEDAKKQAKEYDWSEIAEREIRLIRDIVV